MRERDRLCRRHGEMQPGELLGIGAQCVAAKTHALDEERAVIAAQRLGHDLAVGVDDLQADAGQRHALPAALHLDGAIDLEVQVETSLTTSMGFGGPDLRDLYITTARHRLTEAQAREQPRAGDLFVCRPGPQGRPPNLFLGA